MSESAAPRDDAAPQYEASVERLTDVQCKLAVEIPWDEVKGRLDEAYQDLGKGVNIKGFRRGKVPRKLLEQMFGQAVHKEVSQRLVQESMAKVVTDEDLAPVAEPEVEQDDITEGEAFRYSAVLEVVPEVVPKDYFGAEVAQRPAKVTDEQLDQALEAKRNEQTEYKAIEGRVTQTGDVLMVDVLGKVGDQPVSMDGRLVELGDPPKEPMAGLAAKLEGIEVGEPDQELEVELEMPAQTEGQPASQARLLVTIKDAKQKVVPELDDEFAKDTGEAETLEELKDKLRAQLLESDEQRAKQEAKERLVQQLADANEVPVVPALVERQLDQMLRFQKMMFGGAAQQFDMEQLREPLRPEAEKTVRSALLVQAISKKEDVQVDDADLEKRMAELASARGQNVAKVRSEYEKEGRMDQLRSVVREEKTLDLIMAKATVVIKEIEDTEAKEDTSDAAEQTEQSE